MKRIYNPASNALVSEIDHKALHSFIITKISTEFSNMVQNCYYPETANIYNDILHMTHSKEKDLLEYSKQKYKDVTYHLLHDPFTTLLILIVQEFLRNKDLAAAEATFHLWSLRQYGNLLHRYTTKRGSRKSLCLPDAFQTALDRLSKNHMFVKQKTIPNSIIYYSRAIFKIHLRDLIKDNPDGLHLMIYALRTRINQSMNSFFHKYYEVIDEDKMSKSEKEGTGDYDPSHETKLRAFISKIISDICIYNKIDNNAIVQSSSLIKFNKKLSEEYAKQLSSPKFSERLESALYLVLKDIKDTHFIKSTQFIDYVQKLMSIKVTKQQIYFKKIISDIHLEIVNSLGLQKWYEGLSVQSKAISRNFIAYYLAFYIRNYV
jgi:hypothetical protein